MDIFATVADKLVGAKIKLQIKNELDRLDDSTKLQIYELAQRVAPNLMEAGPLLKTLQETASFDEVVVQLPRMMASVQDPHEDLLGLNHLEEQQGSSTGEITCPFCKETFLS